MSSVGEKVLAFDENFIATPHQITLREKILFLGLLSVFLSFFFVFVFWPIETTTATLQGLTNQVTLSSEHMNYLFWA